MGDASTLLAIQLDRLADALSRGERGGYEAAGAAGRLVRQAVRAGLLVGTAPGIEDLAAQADQEERELTDGTEPDAGLPAELADYGLWSRLAGPGGLLDRNYPDVLVFREPEAYELPDGEKPEDRCRTMLRDLAERDATICRWLAGKLKQSTPADPFVPTKLQRDILKALDGRGLTKDALAAKVSDGDGRRLYRPGGLPELRERGLVRHKPGVGFYRPDVPPKCP